MSTTRKWRLPPLRMTVRTRSKSLFRYFVPLLHYSICLFRMFKVFKVFNFFFLYLEDGKRYQRIEMYDHICHHGKCSVHAFSWIDLPYDLHYSLRNTCIGTWNDLDSGILSTVYSHVGF